MLAVHHTGYEGFLRAATAWRELSAAQRPLRFFQTLQWYGAYFAHLRPADAPIGLIELRDEGQCIGLIPYQRQRLRRHGIAVTVLSLPASPQMILSDAVLRHDLEATTGLRAIQRALARDRLSWQALRLGTVPEDSHAMRLAGALGHRAIVRPAGRSRYFDATEPYESLSGRFSGPLRKNLRKGARRLEQLGRIEFLSIGGGDARMPWAFERFLALEASGWKGAGGTRSAIALSAGVEPFYRDLINAEGEALRCEINLLCLEGEPIAAQLATVCAAQRSIHKIAYDESFQHASPGTLLLAHTLERSCRDETIRTLSLVTDMPWMRDWNASYEALYEVWIPRNALLCALARASLGVRGALRARRSPQA